MNFHMLVQISSLSKAEIAIFESTLIRSLICVNPKMVEEIVPFSEPFVAIFMVTFKDFDKPLRLRIFISENPELFGRWNMLLDLNRM
jgi:hypothetical protein